MKKNKTVCIIDDEHINQFIVTSIIKSINKDILILSYENGEKAMEFLTKIHLSGNEMPDIILLDINMPVSSGWQFMDEFIKVKPEISKNISIYILSSSNDPADKRKAKTYKEISGYLCRPVEPYTLKKIIEYVN